MAVALLSAKLIIRGPTKKRRNPIVIVIIIIIIIMKGPTKP